MINIFKGQSDFYHMNLFPVCTVCHHLTVANLSSYRYLDIEGFTVKSSHLFSLYAWWASLKISCRSRGLQDLNCALCSVRNSFGSLSLWKRPLMMSLLKVAIASGWSGPLFRKRGGTSFPGASGPEITFLSETGWYWTPSIILMLGLNASFVLQTQRQLEVRWSMCPVGIMRLLDLSLPSA